MRLRKFIGPGYVRTGPITYGCFGVGCLIPAAMFLTAIGIIVKGK